MNGEIECRGVVRRSFDPEVESGGARNEFSIMHLGADLSAE